MKDHQTPQKELDLGNRRSKESHSKKPQKIAKKRLSSVFSTAYEDVSDPDHSGEINDSSVSELNKIISVSSEASVLTDLTPTSKLLTKDNEQVEFSAINLAPNVSNAFSVEAGIVANLLIEARSQVLNSVGADHRSKRLLDALVNIVVDEFSTLPEEKALCLQLVSKKAVVLCFMFWTFLAIVALFLIGSVAQGTSARPLPT